MWIRCARIAWVAGLILLSLFRTTPASGGPGRLYLHNADPITTPKSDHSLLLREIFRQAMLMSARDGYDVVIRDGALREKCPDSEKDKDAWIMNLAVDLTIDKPLVLELRRGLGADANALWKSEFPVSMENRPVLTDMISLAERLSRTEFPDALKRAGLPILTRPRDVSATDISSETEPLLGKLNIASQFDGLRRLHVQERKHGQSPELLAALSRGYANLALLCGGVWHAQPQVFTARSLLYAERLAATDSKLAYPARAYARAIAGLPAAAIKDLEIAQKAKESLPEYVHIAEAFCRFQTEVLLNHCKQKKPAAGLAGHLALLTMRARSSDAIQDALTTALSGNPANSRLIECLWNSYGVGLGERLAAASLQLLGGVTWPALGDIAGFPKEAAAALPKTGLAPEQIEAIAEGLFPADIESDDLLSHTAQLIEALVRAGNASSDCAEPSWECLGRIVEGVTFTQLTVQIRYYDAMLAISADKYIQRALQIVPDHACVNYWRALTTDAKARESERNRLLLSVDLTDLGIQSMPYFWAMNYGGLSQTQSDDRYWLMMSHGDETSESFEWRRYFRDTESVEIGRKIGRRLTHLSPWTPTAGYFVVRYDWDSAKAELDALKERFKADPMFLRLLGQGLVEHKLPSDAIAILRSAIGIEPSANNYRWLARAYLASDDHESWQRTLDEYLKLPDEGGLWRTNVLIEAARQLMSEGKFQNALPYAEGAARSWSADGLRCAAGCHRALKNWEKAEYFYRCCSERYTDSRIQWFGFCAVTGKGDRAAAFDLVSAWADSVNPATAQNVATVRAIGGVLFTQKDYSRATKYFRRQYELDGDLTTGLYLALCGELTGDLDLRDSTLRKIAERGDAAGNVEGRKRPELIEFASIWSKSAPNRAVEAESIARLNVLSESVSGVGRSTIGYLAGQILLNRKQTAEGDRFIRMAAEDRSSDNWPAILARDYFRGKGEEIENAQIVITPIWRY